MVFKTNKINEKRENFTQKNLKKSKTTTVATTNMNIGMTNLSYWSKSVGFKIFKTNVKLFFKLHFFMLHFTKITRVFCYKSFKL